MGYLLILPVLFAITFLGYGIYYFNTRKKTRSEYEQKWDNLLKSGFTPDMNHTYSRFIKIPDGGDIVYNYLALDMEQGLCAYDFRVFSMDDIVKIELLSDSSIVQTASSKFGGGGLIGVVVPAVTGFGGGSQQHSGEDVVAVAIRLTLDNQKMPSVMIPFLFEVVPKSSAAYRNAFSIASEVYGIFEGFIKYRDKHFSATAKSSNKNEIYCIHCGAVMSDEARFCAHCGKETKREKTKSTPSKNQKK